MTQWLSSQKSHTTTHAHAHTQAHTLPRKSQAFKNHVLFSRYNQLNMMYFTDKILQ